MCVPLQELIAINSALDLSHRIYYWWTSNGRERCCQSTADFDGINILFIFLNQ